MFVPTAIHKKKYSLQLGKILNFFQKKLMYEYKL